MEIAVFVWFFLVAVTLSNAASPSDVVIRLYTRTNPDVPQIIPSDDASQLGDPGSPFDPTKLNFFSIHGYQGDYLDESNQLVKVQALIREDLNFFVVDYSAIASLDYVTAVLQTRSVGEIVGAFINAIKAIFGVSSNLFICAGHSLGAHVCGTAGAIINPRMSMMLFLDAARPGFDVLPISQRADSSDGQFTIAIHTDGQPLGVGWITPLAHVDYFPNGGSFQNGCSPLPAQGCSHPRSYIYFAESINTVTGFVARKCSGYTPFLLGSCNSNPTSLMGGLYPDLSASGSYYLRTNAAPPYARG